MPRAASREDTNGHQSYTHSPLSAFSSLFYDIRTCAASINL